MEYNKIVAVTGIAGLFELVTSKADGAIVRSLDDNTTKFISSRVHNFSHLESIEVYTVNQNVNLVEVFKAMKDSATALPANRDNESLKKYFKEVFPDLDFEWVYASDMKKMMRWYEILKDKVDFKIPEDTEGEPAEVPSDEEK